MPSFRLLPFPGQDAPAGVSIEGDVARDGGMLRARYRVVGDARALVLPAPAAAPRRRDGLWRSSCFELFVGARGDEGYLEVNLAPSGDWNVYRFARPREGMAPLDPAGFAGVPAVRGRETGTALSIGFTLALSADLSGTPLEVGASAVIEQSDGRVAHFALAHPAAQPDFHRRDGWTLRL